MGSPRGIGDDTSTFLGRALGRGLLHTFSGFEDADAADGDDASARIVAGAAERGRRCRLRPESVARSRPGLIGDGVNAGVAVRRPGSVLAASIMSMSVGVDGGGGVAGVEGVSTKEERIVPGTSRGPIGSLSARHLLLPFARVSFSCSGETAISERGKQKMFTAPLSSLRSLLILTLLSALSLSTEANQLVREDMTLVREDLTLTRSTQASQLQLRNATTATTKPPASAKTKTTARRFENVVNSATVKVGGWAATSVDPNAAQSKLLKPSSSGSGSGSGAGSGAAAGAAGAAASASGAGSGSGAAPAASEGAPAAASPSSSAAQANL